VKKRIGKKSRDRRYRHNAQLIRNCDADGACAGNALSLCLFLSHITDKRLPTVVHMQDN